jgi:hypothetical protein
MSNPDKLIIADAVSASMIRGVAHGDHNPLHGRYKAVCLDKDGNVKWVEEYDNVVTDVGVILTLNTILAGSAFTAAVVMGLKGTGTAAVTDTQASHATWLEVGATNAPVYSGTRKTPTFSAASGSGAGSRSKTTASTVNFSFTSSGTVYGSFININGSATIDNTTGTLFSAGDFATSRAVISGDTLQVTYTLSA